MFGLFYAVRARSEWEPRASCARAAILNALGHRSRTSAYYYLAFIRPDDLFSDRVFSASDLSPSRSRSKGKRGRSS